MTAMLWIVLAGAVAMGLGVVAYEWRRTTPAPAPPPWITREEVDAMFAERDMRPVRWATEQNLGDAETRLRALIANTPDEIHAMVVRTLERLPETYVPRAELVPLVAAYCRKALDEGGELRARVLDVTVDARNAMSAGRIQDDALELAKANIANLRQRVDRILSVPVSCGKCQSSFWVLPGTMGGVHDCGFVYELRPGWSVTRPHGASRRARPAPPPHRDAARKRPRPVRPAKNRGRR